MAIFIENLIENSAIILEKLILFRVSEITEKLLFRL